MQDVMTYLQGNYWIFWSVVGVCYFFNGLTVARWTYRANLDLDEDDRLMFTFFSFFLNPVVLPIYLIVSNVLLPFFSFIHFVVVKSQKSN